MSSLWLRKLALAGATLAPTSLAFSHYTQKPTQSITALRATPLKQCVGGSWVESSSKATIDVEDPTTGALIGKVPEGTAADAHAALVAAKEAQPAWAKTAPAARGEALKAMARVIRANRVELAELLAKEQAKVAGLAQVEIDFTAEYFDYYAGWARIYEAGEIISSDVVRCPRCLPCVNSLASLAGPQRAHLPPQDPARRERGHLSLELSRVRHGAQARARARDGQHRRREIFRGDAPDLRAPRRALDGV